MRHEKHGGAPPPTGEEEEDGPGPARRRKMWSGVERRKRMFNFLMSWYEHTNTIWYSLDPSIPSIDCIETMVLVL
jgi:hypothetical protein